MDLVRTRLAAQTTSHYYTGISHALRTIVQDEGLGGLYRGLSATLMQVGAASEGMSGCRFPGLLSELQGNHQPLCHGVWLTHAAGWP